MPVNRKRNVQVKFYLSNEEAIQLAGNMKEAGIRNKNAYLRKMALDGFVIKQDYDAIRKLSNELNRIGVNLNQMARVANDYGDLYLTEIREVKKELRTIWRQLISGK